MASRSMPSVADAMVDVRVDAERCSPRGVALAPAALPSVVDTHGHWQVATPALRRGNDAITM